jgi:hypothetical protein
VYAIVESRNRAWWCGVWGPREAGRKLCPTFAIKRARSGKCLSEKAPGFDVLLDLDQSVHSSASSGFPEKCKEETL